MVYLITGANGTTVGDVYKVGDGQRIQYLHKYAVQFWWDITVAETITALEIKLWGSADGIHFPGEPICVHTVTAAELAAEGGKFSIVNVPVVYIKGEISALTKTGGTAEVDVVFMPTFNKSF